MPAMTKKKKKKKALQLGAHSRSCPILLLSGAKGQALLAG